MLSNELYAILRYDFILEGITDEWTKYLPVYMTEVLTDEYKKSSMGLVFDFTDYIERVFTSVFLSDAVVNKISKHKNSMLLVHHPMMWDLEKYEKVFGAISPESVNILKESNISVFNMHTPLDNFSEYGTSKTLAEALGLEIIKPFVEYFGTVAAVVCNSQYKTLNDLKEKYMSITSHEISMYAYGNPDIYNQLVAVAAGGGNDFVVINEMEKEGINTLVTGVSLINDHTEKLHKYEKEHNINILGGTHYSSEKFAMIKMCEYFRKLELKSEFIEEKPSLFDL